LNASGGVGASTDAGSSRPTNEAIALVLDGCLYALLGGPASSAFRMYIKRQSSVTIADLIDDPPKFHQCLEGVFGDSTPIIEEFMVKRLVREFGLSPSLCVDMVSTLSALRP